MPLSSSSLIHFTKSKKALIGILKENFKVKFCLEKIITPPGAFEYAIPMVSFCDIPLSQIKQHITKYGSYGIGLSQEWGRKNGLNPVMYVDKESTVGANYRLAFEELVKGKVVSGISDYEARLLDVLRYMKNYEADLVRAGKTIKNYRFADEKEWRYVPDKSQCQFVVSGRGYSKPETKKYYTKQTSSLRLEFEPKDIKYIIVRDESEVLEILRLLSSIKGKYLYDDVQRLTTRLITAEQIIKDF